MTTKSHKLFTIDSDYEFDYKPQSNYGYDNNIANKCKFNLFNLMIEHYLLYDKIKKIISHESNKISNTKLPSNCINDFGNFLLNNENFKQKITEYADELINFLGNDRTTKPFLNEPGAFNYVKNLYNFIIHNDHNIEPFTIDDTISTPTTRSPSSSVGSNGTDGTGDTNKRTGMSSLRKFFNPISNGGKQIHKKKTRHHKKMRPNKKHKKTQKNTI